LSFGRQTGKKFDVELIFICAAFHDLGLLMKFSGATDRFEVDRANAVRQFLEPSPPDSLLFTRMTHFAVPGCGAEPMPEHPVAP
jgi:hypothetical protein